MNICLCRATVLLIEYLWFVWSISCYLCLVGDGFFGSATRILVFLGVCAYMFVLCVHYLCGFVSHWIMGEVCMCFFWYLECAPMSYILCRTMSHYVALCRANHKLINKECLSDLIRYLISMEKPYPNMLSCCVALCRTGKIRVG